MSLTLVTKDVKVACRLARQLERRGEYRAAAEQLRHFWAGVGTRPITDNLASEDQADLLLRAGVLTSWLGCIEQIPGAQSSARDLLSEAVRLFKQEGGIAQCRVTLALTYWREGDKRTGEIVARAALEQCSVGIEERAPLINTVALLAIEQGHLQAARIFLKRHYAEVNKINNPYERLNFHSHLGYVYKKLGEESVDEKERQEFLGLALIEYEGALAWLEELENPNFKARVENNIANTLAAKGTPGLAHRYIQSAIAFAKTARDNSLLGSFEETRARVLLAENNLTGALVAIKSSLAYLRGGDQLALQSESETTHAIILARMGDVDCAESAFAHAIELAEMAQISTVKIRLTRLRELMEHHKTEALRFEKEWVQLALDASEGQPTNAARLIGITHQNMNNKIKRFGLEEYRVPPKTRNNNKKKTA